MSHTPRRRQIESVGEEYCRDPIEGGTSMRTFLFLVVAVSVLLGAPQDSFACSCVMFSSLQALEEEATKACSAFTRVTACTFAKSPNGDPLHRRLQQLRHLHYCSDCYRLERPLPGGIRSH